MITRRDLVTYAAATFAAGSSPRIARAQGWPSRYIRLIVQFAAGGANDAVARVIVQRLSALWGQQIVIENRSGAGGNIAAEAVARADPDGYTLLLGSFPLGVNRFIYPTLAYDPVADFAPVSLLCVQPNIMIVPNTSTARSVADFIAYANANKGKVTFASAGTGSSVHLCGEMFKRMTGIEMTHVPYRGTAPAMNDLIPGRVDTMFNIIISGLPQVRSGTVRALGVTTARRTEVAPDLPTIAETVRVSTPPCWGVFPPPPPPPRSSSGYAPTPSRRSPIRASRRPPPHPRRRGGGGCSRSAPRRSAPRRRSLPRISNRRSRSGVRSSAMRGSRPRISACG